MSDPNKVPPHAHQDGNSKNKVMRRMWRNWGPCPLSGGGKQGSRYGKWWRFSAENDLKLGLPPDAASPFRGHRAHGHGGSDPGGAKLEATPACASRRADKHSVVRMHGGLSPGLPKRGKSTRAAARPGVGDSVPSDMSQAPKDAGCPRRFREVPGGAHSAEPGRATEAPGPAEAGVGAPRAPARGLRSAKWSVSEEDGRDGRTIAYSMPLNRTAKHG